MKPLFAGKITLTDHAKDRCKERGVNFNYIRQQLVFIPYEEGRHAWYIPKTDLFVVYQDVTEKLRVIITMGHRDPDRRLHNG